MSDPVLPKPLRVAGIVFGWLLGALLVAAIGAMAWVGVRGLEAYGHLRDAEATARETVTKISDPAQASGLIDRLAADTSAARALTSDPVWAVAERMPWIGPQLHAVSTVAAAADDVAGSALKPLAGVAASFSIDSFRPTGGKIDTAMFAEIAEPARLGADGVAAASASVSALDGDLLLGPVRDAVSEVADMLETSAKATDALARASALLPSMLGADGARDYLVVFQNNAEWRSLGGIVGAMAVIHTDAGAMSMTAQGSSSDFRKYDEPVVTLDPEITRIFEKRPAQWIQNVTQVPDFSVTGELAREMWKRETGVEVDGVLALDPVALSYLLKATGPVTLPTGDLLTSDNAVQLLLNDVYERYEKPADQDAFFAAAAAAVFDTLATGSANPTALVTALGRAGDERRLLMWSATPEDQAVIAETTLAGGLPVTDHETARFGVFLNDGTGSKMDYYVTADTTLGWDACTVDARDRTIDPVTLTLTLTNTAPADAATSLPEYITGGGSFGVPAGVARTVAYLYLPEGYTLMQASRTDAGGFGGGFHQGRQVLTFSTDLEPGASATATITVQPPEPGAATVTADVTPTVDADVPTRIGAECAAAYDTP